MSKRILISLAALVVALVPLAPTVGPLHADAARVIAPMQLMSNGAGGGP